MLTSPYYVICCRCGKPDDAHCVEGRYITRLYWWLWCHDCVGELRQKACSTHD
jgi:translation initiation factor 2 beta subunit (eIF-2beta)/eIF-5